MSAFVEKLLSALKAGLLSPNPLLSNPSELVSQLALLDPNYWLNNLTLDYGEGELKSLCRQFCLMYIEILKHFLIIRMMELSEKNFVITKALKVLPWQTRQYAKKSYKIPEVSVHWHCIFYVENSPKYPETLISEEDISQFVDQFIFGELPDESTVKELHGIVTLVIKFNLPLYAITVFHRNVQKGFL